MGGLFMKESSFTRTVRQRLSPSGHWTRIENVTGVGIPDACWYPGDQFGDVWIEFKATTTNQIKFQSSQISWAKQRHKRHGFVWVVIRTEKQMILTKSSYVYDKVRYTSSNKPTLHLSVAKDLGVTFIYPFNWETFIDMLLCDVEFEEMLGNTL